MVPRARGRPRREKPGRRGEPSFHAPLERECVADRRAVEDGGAVSEEDAGFQLGHRLVVPHAGDLHLARDRVARADRRPEGPVDLQEDGARTGQFFGDDGVQDRAGHTTLYDDAAEARRRGGGFVVVQRVPVTADIGEQRDVARRYVPRPPGRLTDRRLSMRPYGGSCVHGSIASSTSHSIDLILLSVTAPIDTPVPSKVLSARDSLS